MKPVAWITKSCKCYSTPLKAMEDSNKEELIPVYTEPRELSDEEIWAIASEIEPIDLAYGVRLSNEWNVLDFARAILKKASEK